MQIAQLIDVLYIGGAERLLVTFSEAAPTADIHTTVIALRVYPETPFLTMLHSLGIPVLEFRGRNLIDPIRFIRLVNYLRRQKFDVVHLHLTYSIILGSLAARLADIPVVASVHNTQPDRWAALETFALKYWVDSVVGVGHEVSMAYQPRLGKRRMETILNAVNLPVRISTEERLALRSQLTDGNSEAVLVLAVGRLAPQKGYNDLLAAMRFLKKENIPVQLAIAGIGELQDTLMSRIRELDLQDTVKLLGSRSDVAQLLAACDVFVNSSHWEGLPVAVLEAMAAGLPVAATSVGDLPNIIKDNMGILVPPQRPEQLAAALRRLCTDAPLRSELGGNARDYVAIHHSPETWVRQLLDLYLRVARKEN